MEKKVKKQLKFVSNFGVITSFMDTLNESHNKLNDRFGQSMVLLWYNNSPDKNPINSSIGTGFLVYYKNKKYIFSCHHVINEFMNALHKKIKFQYDPAKPFYLNNIINSKTDDQKDVGYIELNNDSNISHLIMINENDFHLNEVIWGSNAFLVYGYPSQLGEFSNSYFNQSFQPFSFLTQHTLGINDYSFDYPSDQSAQIEGADTIPVPYGISGAPVIMFEITPNKIADLTKAKIIGIEHSWDSGKSIFFASPISTILDLIK